MSSQMASRIIPDTAVWMLNGSVFSSIFKLSELNGQVKKWKIRKDRNMSVLIQKYIPDCFI